MKALLVNIKIGLEIFNTDAAATHFATQSACL